MTLASRRNAPPARELDLVSETVDRLKACLDRAVLPTVHAALQLGDAPPPKLPAAVVLLLADVGSESAAPRVGAYQQVEAMLGVVHVIRSLNDPRAAGAIDPMKALTGRTRSVLNGWLPDPDRPGADALTFRRGRLVDIADGAAVWQDEYSIAWLASRVQKA